MSQLAMAFVDVAVWPPIGDHRLEHAVRNPPRARNTDPVTSHEAARDVTESGQADTEAELVLGTLRSYCAGGHVATSRELAIWGRLDRYMVARRLPELRDRSLVWNHHPRRCTVSDKNAMTWSTNPPTAGATAPQAAGTTSEPKKGTAA